MKVEFKYRNTSGNISTGYMSLEDYRLAGETRMKPAAVVNARHSDADMTYGSAFEQGTKYLGIFPKGDTRYGILPTTLKDILDGSCTTKLSGFQLAGGTIVSPKSPIGGDTPSSRLFFPSIIMQIIEDELRADYGAEEAAWSRMFAINQSIQSEVWTQPVISYSGPGSQDMKPIGQNQMPANMVSITASETSRALGQIAIGLQVSQQALRDTTLDLVGIIVKEQTMGQRMRHLWRDISRVATGNPDANQEALTPVSFKTAFDATAAANTVTHDGYVKMLWNPERTYAWNALIGPLGSYMAIERRTGRPLAYDPKTSGYNSGNPGTYGINPGEPQLINFAMSNPMMMLIPDGILAANQVLALDTRFALARVTNVSANYQALEEQVLQRSLFWRWDLSEHVYRFREEAIQLVDWTNS